MTNKIERRAFASDAPVEVRGDGEGRAISGYAALFNTRTEIGGYFTEEIAPGAFKDLQDVRALWNHDSNHPIGRMGKNLSLKQDKRGLYFEIDPLPDTTTGNEVLENIRSGLVDGMSFGFEVLKDEWTRGEDDESDHRVIREVKLWEVSPVTFPAYKDTEVNLRSYEQFKEQVEGTDVDARKRRLKFKKAAHQLAR